MPFTNNMGQRSGPTKRWAWSSIHIVWYPLSVFAENWLYCVGLLELCGYIFVLQLVQDFLRALYRIAVAGCKAPTDTHAQLEDIYELGNS